ncbi:hypothetical protein [Bartonella sp. DGB2]|uniref:hypothetical protein n=1 Tax=Bartonella sp. DGB2 TaxID=3388426 RepID=UPI00398FCBE1
MDGRISIEGETVTFKVIDESMVKIVSSPFAKTDGDGRAEVDSFDIDIGANRVDLSHILILFENLIINSYISNFTTD